MGKVPIRDVRSIGGVSRDGEAREQSECGGRAQLAERIILDFLQQGTLCMCAGDG